MVAEYNNIKQYSLPTSRNTMVAEYNNNKQYSLPTCRYIMVADNNNIRKYSVNLVGKEQNKRSEKFDIYFLNIFLQMTYFYLLTVMMVRLNFLKFRKFI